MMEALPLIAQILICFALLVAFLIIWLKLFVKNTWQGGVAKW